MKKWSDSPRIDLCYMEHAISQGWTPEFDWRDKTHNRTTPDNCPHNPVGYKKGVVHAWKCIDYKKHVPYFRVANMREGKFYNHRNYDSMAEVIENEKIFE